MSKQTIGPREQQLRDMRAREAATSKRPAIERNALAANLPATSGKKPMKKKRP